MSRNKMNENQASKAKKGKSRKGEKDSRPPPPRSPLSAARAAASSARLPPLRASDPKIQRWPIRDPASHWHIGLLPVFGFSQILVIKAKLQQPKPPRGDRARREDGGRAGEIYSWRKVEAIWRRFQYISYVHITIASPWRRSPPSFYCLPTPPLAINYFLPRSVSTMVLIVPANHRYGVQVPNRVALV